MIAYAGLFTGGDGAGPLPLRPDKGVFGVGGACLPPGLYRLGKIGKTSGLIRVQRSAKSIKSIHGVLGEGGGQGEGLIECY